MNTVEEQHTAIALALARFAGYGVTPEAAAEAALNNGKKAAVKKTKGTDKNASLVLLRLINLRRQSPVKEFNITLLCGIHRSIFTGIISGAGVLRKYDIVKESACCISYKLLRASLKAALRQLDRKRLNLMTRNEAAMTLCHFCREFLILSPFAQGSELAMHVLLGQFCDSCGLMLDYSKCGAELPEAEKICLVSDDVRPLYDCFVKALSHKRPKQRIKPVLLLSAPKKIKEKRIKDKTKKKPRAGAKQNIKSKSKAAAKSKK